MCIGIPSVPVSKNEDLIIQNCLALNTESFVAMPAEAFGAPYPGCYAFEAGELYMSVYQGNVKNGAHVVFWPLCVPGTGACGNPSDDWHPDQFWCPED